MNYFAACLIFAGCLNTYMMFRNNWVRDFLLEELDKSEHRGEGFLYPFSLLPSYQRILWTFWVLDFYKFYPEEYRAFLRLRSKSEKNPEVHSL